MGKQISNSEQQVSYLKDRLQMFLEVLDSIEPETTNLEDIDRLIQKMEQFKDSKE